MKDREVLQNIVRKAWGAWIFPQEVKSDLKKVLDAIEAGEEINKNHMKTLKRVGLTY